MDNTYITENQSSQLPLIKPNTSQLIYSQRNQDTDGNLILLEFGEDIREIREKYKTGSYYKENYQLVETYQ